MYIELLVALLDMNTINKRQIINTHPVTHMRQQASPQSPARMRCGKIGHFKTTLFHCPREIH